MVRRAPRRHEARQDAAEDPERAPHARALWRTAGAARCGRWHGWRRRGLGHHAHLPLALRNEELVVDYPAHALGLSEKGRTLAAGMRKPETRRELHDIWLGSKKMGGTPRRMLEILIHTYPDTISKQALCAEVGVKANTGTMRTYLSKLRTPGLMVDVGGELRAADMLFPKGLKP
jgi:hypothetical protein